jgi:hypothetical protein
MATPVKWCGHVCVLIIKKILKKGSNSMFLNYRYIIVLNDERIEQE